MLTQTPYDIKRPKQIFSSPDELLHQQLILACTFGNEEFFLRVLEELFALDSAAKNASTATSTNNTQNFQQQPQGTDNSSSSNTNATTTTTTSYDITTEVINRPNYIGQTPLILCIIKGHFHLANRLLSFKNLSVNSCTYMDKKNALMFAAERGYSVIVVSLLFANNNNNQGSSAVNGIDIDAQDSEGTTALMYACANMNFSSVQALLKGKPNLNLQDHKGRTALHHLFIHNFSSISKRFSLLAGGGGGGSGGSRQNSSVQLIQQALLIAGIDVQIRDSFWKTALDYVNNV